MFSDLSAPHIPRFVLRFTPASSSRLILAERWFAELTAKKLRRDTHMSVRQLNTDIRPCIGNPRSYVWTKTVDQIRTSIGDYFHWGNDFGHNM